MKPSFLNLSMKKFTRERVVPTISASISCEIFGEHHLRFVLRAVARQQQQRASQPLLAGVKELIHQILLDPDVPRKHVRDEPVGKLMLDVEDANHLLLFNDECGSGRNSACRRYPNRLTRQASLTEKIAPSQNRHHGLFARFIHYRKSHPAFLNV